MIPLNLSTVATIYSGDGSELPLHSPININDNENINLLFNLFKDVRHDDDEQLIDRDFIQFLYEENDKDLFSTMDVLRKSLLESSEETAEQLSNVSFPTPEDKQSKTTSLFAALDDPKNKSVAEMARELPNVYFLNNDNDERKINQKKKNKQKSIEKKKKETTMNRERQTKMNQLCEMFPNIDPSIIEAQLIAFDYNVDEAIFAILNQTNKPSNNQQKNKPKNKKGTVRNDLLVGCSRWNTPVSALSGGIGSQAKKSAGNTLSMEMKKEKLKSVLKGKSISMELALDIFDECDQNLSKTLEQLKALYPALFTEDIGDSNLLIRPKQEPIVYGTTIGPKQGVISSNIVDIQKPAVQATSSRLALDELMERRRHFHLPDLVETQSSYTQASHQYTKLRDKFMDLAVRAQQQGKVGLATSFMSKARQYSLIVEDCHVKANEMRLREQSGGEVISKPKTLDLHGLILDDALYTLEVYLEKCKESGTTRRVNIITGAGKHSKNNQPVLLPAVERYLNTNGFSFKQIVPGIFQVRL